MAQLMNYWKYPTSGMGSRTINYTKYGTLTVNFEEAVYDFDNMLDTYTGSNYTDAQRDAVALLMYHCGISVGMQYGPTESVVNNTYPS